MKLSVHVCDVMGAAMITAGIAIDSTVSTRAANASVAVATDAGIWKS